MKQKDNCIYFLHVEDSRLWRYNKGRGEIAFFGGSDATDWRVHSRGRDFFFGIEDWEKFSGTPVTAILNEKKKRKRKRKTII